MITSKQLFIESPLLVTVANTAAAMEKRCHETKKESRNWVVWCCADVGGHAMIFVYRNMQQWSWRQRCLRRERRINVSAAAAAKTQSTSRVLRILTQTRTDIEENVLRNRWEEEYFEEHRGKLTEPIQNQTKLTCCHQSGWRYCAEEATSPKT